MNRPDSRTPARRGVVPFLLVVSTGYIAANLGIQGFIAMLPLVESEFGGGRGQDDGVAARGGARSCWAPARWLSRSRLLSPSRTTGSHRATSRATSVPLATGEHFYGRWDVQNFLERDAIRIVQADPEWCGGVSELVKICAIASVHGAHVIPHGHSLHAAMHVVASQSPTVCPLVEYLINKMEGEWYSLEADPPRAVNGTITLSDRPGFGIELDEAKVASREPISWREV